MEMNAINIEKLLAKLTPKKRARMTRWFGTPLFRNDPRIVHHRQKLAMKRETIRREQAMEQKQ